MLLESMLIVSMEISDLLLPTARSSPQQAGRLPGQETGGPSFGNSSVYDTAEFHLYCRKIIACSKVRGRGSKGCC